MQLPLVIAIMDVSADLIVARASTLAALILSVPSPNVSMNLAHHVIMNVNVFLNRHHKVQELHNDDLQNNSCFGTGVVFRCN